MNSAVRSSLFAIVTTLCLTSACAESVLDSEGAFVPKAGCGQLTCGSNSPSLGDYKAAEIHQDTTHSFKGIAAPNLMVTNEPNQDGLYLIEFRNPEGTPARFGTSDDGEFQIFNETDSITHKGTSVVGSQFDIGSTAAGAPNFTLTIDAYRQDVNYWVGNVESIHAYVISYVEVIVGAPGSSPPKDLCPTLSGPDGGPMIQEIVFSRGERYDFVTRDIFDVGAASDGWYNLACISDGPSKSLLYRHRPEYPVGHPYHTEPEQRQTLLRMFAADYCGTGDTYTTHGHPLTWEDHNGWLTGGGTDVEAVWGPDGVICLDTPRMEASLTPGFFTKAQIEGPGECNKPIPSCAEAVFGGDLWKSHYFKTWNP